MAKSEHTMLEVAGKEVRLSNPGKVYFPKPGWTKLDLAEYYVGMADAVLVHVRERPTVMKRFVKGVMEDPIWQKRVPQKVPDWLETATVAFPSGRTAEELVANDAAHLVWAVNLGVIDFNPWPARRADLDHPDELRVDLDPTPGIGWNDVRRTAMVVRDVLADVGLVGWPKTSGSRGFHIYARIQPRWTFAQVRRAAAGLAAEVARRVPDIATSRWWKEERHGVFVDYNQNAKDRTTASGYSVRPTPDARVSMPLRWEELDGCEPGQFTIDTVPEKFAADGDAWAGIDDDAGSLEALLALADEHAHDEPTGPKRDEIPVIEIARARTKEEAMAGLDRWRSRHPGVWEQLKPADVLVDSMRGRSSTWTRIRLNLQHVPEADRPAQEPLEVDYDPWAGVTGPRGPAAPRAPRTPRR